ncbi:hypothetical protein [Aquirhabdus sp.]|uniref:hypothetical protein n=1 Tax=Aquirhabdus sp. TaxID=2824160 RepID=UPI00396C3CA3
MKKMKSLKQKCLVASTLVLIPLAVSAAEDGQAASVVVAKPVVSSESKPKAEGDSIRWEKKYVNVPEGRWTGPRLADGQPDVQGHWSNTVSNHANFTDPQGGIPGDPQGHPPKGTRADRAPSRVSDPADGEIPYQPWARAKQQEFLQYFFNAIKPEYIEPLARCAPAGVPKSFYWHGYEIRQYPGYVVFLFSSGTRVIHLDGKPHLPENIKLWNADSRGHWEGNTLVVDVTNNNGKARFSRTGDFSSENVHIQEKYIFANDGSRYTYQALVTDPTVYTRPWTVTIPARRYTAKDKPNGWHFEVLLNTRDAKGGEPIIERDERICVENNGGFGQGVKH